MPDVEQRRFDLDRLDRAVDDGCNQIQGLGAGYSVCVKLVVGLELLDSRLSGRTVFSGSGTAF